ARRAGGALAARWGAEPALRGRPEGARALAPARRRWQRAAHRRRDRHEVGARRRGRRRRSRRHRAGRCGLPAAPCPGRRARGPRSRLVLRPGDHRLRRGPGPPGLRGDRLVRPHGHRRRGERRGDARPRCGPGAAPCAARFRPLVRPGTGGRSGHRPRLLPHEALVLMHGLLLATDGAVPAPGFSILSALIIVPAVGALVVAAVPRRRSELHRGIALMFSVAAAALSLYMLAAFDKGAPGFQFETDSTWIESFGISWHLGVDGISLFLVVLTAIL